MKKLFLMLFAVACFNAALHAQVAPVKNEGTIKNVVTRLQTLSTDRVIEKAYLHFDKPYYNPGDTIYFKAYVTAGEGHELSKISGVLHVDLVSKNDSIMQSLILQLKNGLAWGDFALPNYLSKGNYRVRAYTQWMQNAGNTYFFNKTIGVNGKSIAQLSQAKAADNKTDVQFFPEGGMLVAAVPSRIAFKAVGSNGMGAYIRGIVVDNNNVAVAKFTSTHLGMGQVFITPEDGKTYKAKVTYPDGSTNTIDLPKTEAKGMSLSVNNSDLNKLSIDINANKPYYLENKNKEVSVVIYSAGIVKTVKTVLDNQVIGFDLPKKDLKSGITQITLFSESGMPLSERLVFIQNADELTFTVNSDKTTYATHDKAHITLNAKLPENKASVGNFSVSVIDESKVPANEDKESSIFSDLLLTSDLRGYVEQPGYYFNNVNTDTRNNLDILMLTQGYRRFQWKELLNEPIAPIAYKPEFGMQLKGTMVTKAGAPVPNEKVTLMLPATGQSTTITTDAAGKFSFTNMEYVNGTQFLLNIENKSLQNKAKIRLDETNTALPLSANNSPEGKVGEKLPEYTAAIADQPNTVGSRVLKPVYVKEKSNYKTASLAGAGNADQVIFNKQFKNHPTLSQGLTGIARNMYFSYGKAYLRTNTATAGGETVVEPMMIVVDGAITSGDIDNIPPGDVESVEILKGANASIYGQGAGAGVMIINTKRGGDTGEINKEMTPGLVSITPQGFYRAREFYSPVYDAVKKGPAEGQTTIFWKPNLITNEAGNAAFDYLNDGPGQYRIIIEGIDNGGNIGRAVYKYNVQ
ncbi:MG2 domain-containing protein [Mucilaginibacter aquariorum]|uniref:MG2 domain-containing protein n=1 Tax=Mucilaginibacter aquariorum TaxID=2967225 RepID=A0ABT1T6J7_9SPHI|nr:MG2 domain-containing protein [Mucilaginibacter aquariorum]MCQ6960257.1 MG2 domain-containing protein [Mucilaginibacter aquariorum]